MMCNTQGCVRGGACKMGVFRRGWYSRCWSGPQLASCSSTVSLHLAMSVFQLSSRGMMTYDARARWVSSRSIKLEASGQSSLLLFLLKKFGWDRAFEPRLQMLSGRTTCLAKPTLYLYVFERIHPTGPEGSKSAADTHRAVG